MPVSATPDHVAPHVWSPLDFGSDLELYLDSTIPGSITDDGGGLSSAWEDQSSHGDTFTASGAQRPTTGTRTQNGVNVFDCDGSNVLTSTAGLARWKWMVDGTKVYMVGVAAWKDTNSGAGRRWLQVGQSNAERFEVTFDVFGRMNFILAKPPNVAVVQYIAGVASPATSGVSTWIIDPANATAAARLYLAQNGSAPTQPNTRSAAPSSAALVESLRIMELWDGWYGALVIVSGASAIEANRVLLRDWLNTKYAVY